MSAFIGFVSHLCQDLSCLMTGEDFDVSVAYLVF